MSRRRAILLSRPLRGCGIQIGVALAIALAFAPKTASAAPVDLYYERSVMAAANQRCGLFNADLTSALESARAQARGAALRSGFANAALSSVRQRASSRAAATPCDSKDIALAAARVRTAFDGYSKLHQMTFPGDLSSWRADRLQAQRTMTWRLAQSANFGNDGLTFGLAGQAGASGLIAAVRFADNARPYAARLILRDVARAAEPCLGQAGQGLAARMPLVGARSAFLAEARSDADLSLLPRGAASGIAFRFPSAAADALANLDPREAVAVQFLFQGRRGETVRTAYIEVGDFAAGRAFLAAGQR